MIVLIQAERVPEKKGYNINVSYERTYFSLSDLLKEKNLTDALFSYFISLYEATYDPDNQ